MQPKEKKKKHLISYYSKSDGRRIVRPYNPHHDMQYEFIAQGSGNLCKRYFDGTKGGLRTANPPWTISVEEGKNEQRTK